VKKKNPEQKFDHPKGEMQALAEEAHKNAKECKKEKKRRSFYP